MHFQPSLLLALGLSLGLKVQPICAQEEMTPSAADAATVPSISSALTSLAGGLSATLASNTEQPTTDATPSQDGTIPSISSIMDSPPETSPSESDMDASTTYDNTSMPTEVGPEPTDGIEPPTTTATSGMTTSSNNATTTTSRRTDDLVESGNAAVVPTAGAVPGVIGAGILGLAALL